MLNRTVRIGTRTSPLALIQVEEVLTSLRKSLRRGGLNLPYMRFEIIGIDTYGDKDRKTPISDMEGTDFFTREIEEALLKGEIDFAVHSAKDLPDIIPDGLRIAAVTGSIDPYDALVSRDNLKIDELPSGARIGASSQRRKEQLKKYRKDFNIVDIRGNIEERLSLVDHTTFPLPSGERIKVRGKAVHIAPLPLPSPQRGEGGAPRFSGAPLDAIIVAACALIRLGLEHRIAQRVPFEILKPHPLQGALAIEVRQTDKEIIDLVSRLSISPHPNPLPAGERAEPALSEAKGVRGEKD